MQLVSYDTVLCSVNLNINLKYMYTHQRIVQGRIQEFLKGRGGGGGEGKVNYRVRQEGHGSPKK